MKLTLQLVVVVLNAPTTFRDNQFKFTLYTIIIYKEGDTRCHLRRHALIQHNFFHEIRTRTENKHARIIAIGQQQIQKPMKLSQKENASLERAWWRRQHLVSPSLYIIIVYRVNLKKLSRNFVGALRITATNCRVSFIDLYLVFRRNFRIVFTSYKYCNFTGTVLWYYHRAWVTCGQTCEKLQCFYQNLMSSKFP